MRAKIFNLPSDDARAFSFELNPNTPLEEWITIGARIIAERNRSAWRLGDWWRLGELAYGERRRTVEQAGWTGPSFQVMADYAWISGRFPPARGRKSLTLQHHREVARLEPEKADKLLDWAEEPLREGKRWPRSTRELREEMHRRHDPPPWPHQGVVTHAPASARNQTFRFATTAVETRPDVATMVSEPVSVQPVRRTITTYVDEAEPEAPNDLLAEARALARRLDDRDARHRLGATARDDGRKPHRHLHRSEFVRRHTPSGDGGPAGGRAGAVRPSREPPPAPHDAISDAGMVR